MLVKKLKKQMATAECYGCKYGCPSQKDHYGYGGCMEETKDVFDWLSFSDAYEETVRVLHLQQKYDRDAMDTWKVLAIENAKKILMNYEPDASKSQTVDVDLTDELVNRIADSIRILHMEFHGCAILEDCPKLHHSDISIHLLDALGMNGIGDLNYYHRYDLATKLESILTPGYRRPLPCF